MRIRMRLWRGSAKGAPFGDRCVRSVAATTALVLLVAGWTGHAAADDAVGAGRAQVGYTLPLARAVNDGGSERDVGWLRNNGIYSDNAAKLAQGGGFVSADQLSVANAANASRAASAGSADTATFSTSAGSAATAAWSTNAGWSSTAAWADGATSANTATRAGTADSATVAGFANSAGTAGSADTANRANTSAYADNSGRSNTSGYADNSGRSNTSAYADNSGTANNAGGSNFIISNNAGSGANSPPPDASCPSGSLTSSISISSYQYWNTISLCRQ
jgi:hypothetical protein